VLDDTVRAERAAGIYAGHAWIPRACLVAVYCDLGFSQGMIEGIIKAGQCNVRVELRRLDD